MNKPEIDEKEESRLAQLEWDMLKGRAQRHGSRATVALCEKLDELEKQNSKLLAELRRLREENASQAYTIQMYKEGIISRDRPNKDAFGNEIKDIFDL